MPFVTPETIFDMHAPRNPRLMEGAFYLNLVQMNREGTRRMRETMASMNLPEPVFNQNQIGYSIVRVELKNDIDKRRVWVDQDISKIVGTAIVAQFGEREKRVLNWIAEYQTCTVNDVVRILKTDWASAKKLLVKLVRKEVLQYFRFKPMGDRDTSASFRLRSDATAPDGMWDASDQL